MTQERIPDPIEATRRFDSLLIGIGSNGIDEVRETYRLVAQNQARLYPDLPSVRFWGSDPMEVARCFALKIDPESGEDIDDPMDLMERYRLRGLYGQVMSEYESLMNNPALIRALPRLPRLY